MSTRKIILWIFLLVVIDQAIKIVINSFFFDLRFEIIPSLFEFKPVFNSKHTYANNLLIKHFDIDMGFWFHIFLFLFIGLIIMPFMWFSFRQYIPKNKKLLDVAMIFVNATVICAIIGNVIWEKGTLDYIYLKPLFTFDLKDLYSNCFIILFLLYALKNGLQIHSIKSRDAFVSYLEWLRKNKNLRHIENITKKEIQPEKEEDGASEQHHDYMLESNENIE